MTGSRKFFVGGNFKCNGNKSSLQTLIESIIKSTLPASEIVDIVVSPPSIYLEYVNQLVGQRVQVAAQNCYSETKGAYTGEISAEMIVDIGLKWVILGHSERRNLFKESNQLIAKKTQHALSQGLSVIFCIGELLEQRETNKTEQVLDEQLGFLLNGVVSDWSKVVIAYEPVWAIGTGKTASPQQAQDAHAFIRKWLSEKVSKEVANATRILYGGSVTATNSAELSKQLDVDGFLVGGASLVASDFVTIINTANPKSYL
ncbi:triose phosphate isomerase [Cavenderia fasciculata]|uniref:Triosephosphate isomerase n=1 Tax=Cavenderia fasciculata TaxID=261658 RepID=F4PYV4_CACFS|nr:triose phosphate isomerase [Cavenderia fasciculata]EGG18983.1 triose phosphate isomerase [Cavenderia fasciculata]|eukprot:XP_004357462.1 triose phosphate isomerase [Cavenderia fasciculata]